MNLSALLLLLVLPIAVIGRRWGREPALAAAVAALALVGVQDGLMDVGIPILGYVGRGTVFAVVALLASDGGPRRAEAAATVQISSLTPRELEVLALIAAGKTNAEIAADLFLSEHTVRSHVKHILAKLSVRNRVEAALVHLSVQRAPSISIHVPKP